VINAGNLTQC